MKKTKVKSEDQPQQKSEAEETVFQDNEAINSVEEIEVVHEVVEPPKKENLENFIEDQIEKEIMNVTFEKKIIHSNQRDYFDKAIKQQREAIKSLRAQVVELREKLKKAQELLNKRE